MNDLCQYNYTSLFLKVSDSLAKKLLDLLYIELLLDEFLFVSMLKFNFLQLKVLIKGNIGISAEGRYSFFSNYFVVDVNADIVESFLTSEQSLVDYSSWPTFAPSYCVLSYAHLTSAISCKNAAIRVVYLIIGLVKLGWNNGADFKASAVYQ